MLLLTGVLGSWRLPGGDAVESALDAVKVSGTW